MINFNMLQKHYTIVHKSNLLFLILFLIGTTAFSQGNCGVTYTTTSSSITLSGLDAPHTILKVFNPDWSINYECVDNCSNPLTVSSLSAGTYHLSVNTYDANWSPTCDFLEDVTITSGGGGNDISLNCPADILNDPIPGNLVPFDWPLPTGSTTCSSGGLTITQIGGPTRGTSLLANNGTYTIEYEATDNCGNSTTCSFTFTEQTWVSTVTFVSCPQDITVQATSAQGAIVSYPTPEAITDSPCTGVFYNQNPATESGNLFPIGTTQVVIIAESTGGVGAGCFGSEACVFNVTVTDGSGGNDITLNCPADILNDPVPGNLVPFDWPLPTGSTTCSSGGLTITQIGGPTRGTSLLANNGTYTIEYEATDNCGNSTTCSFTFTEQTWVSTVTFVSCPQDITVQATSAQGAIVSYPTPEAITDSPCTGVFYNQDPSTESGSLFPVGTTQVVIIAESTGGVGAGCFGSEACIFNVTVTDDNSGGDCNVNVTTASGGITVTGLDAPHVIFKLFNPNWTINTECFDNCANPLTINNLSAGQTYHVSYQLYDANWQPICDDLVDVVVGGGGNGGSDPCDIDYTINGNSLTLSGLTSEVSVKLFQVGIDFECGPDVGTTCPQSTTITGLNDGFYTLSVYTLGTADDCITDYSLEFSGGSGGGENNLPCDIDYSISNGTMTISGAGLNSPHVILKLFSPSWSTIYECVDNCGNTITIPNLGSGTHHLSVNLYNANWQSTCDFIEDVPVGSNRLVNKIPLEQHKNIVLNKLYPVPANDVINIEISSLGDTELFAKIYDARGVAVDQKSVQLVSGNNTIQWNTNDLPTGFYQIVFDSPNKHQPIRFIKQRL